MSRFNVMSKIVLACGGGSLTTLSSYLINSIPSDKELLTKIESEFGEFDNIKIKPHLFYKSADVMINYECVYNYYGFAGSWKKYHD